MIDILSDSRVNITLKEKMSEANLSKKKNYQKNVAIVEEPKKKQVQRRSRQFVEKYNFKLYKLEFLLRRTNIEDNNVEEAKKLVGKIYVMFKINKHNRKSRAEDSNGKEMDKYDKSYEVTVFENIKDNQVHFSVDTRLLFGEEVEMIITIGGEPGEWYSENDESQGNNQFSPNYLLFNTFLDYKVFKPTDICKEYVEEDKSNNYQFRDQRIWVWEFDTKFFKGKISGRRTTKR